MLFEPYTPRHVGEARIAIERDWHVRAALPDDAAALARIAIEREGGDLGARRAKFSTEILKCIEERVPEKLLVAAGDETVLGFGRSFWFERPGDASLDVVPTGWYLGGVIVARSQRRRGIGADLTRARMAWIARHADHCHFVCNVQNRASLDLHTQLGFVETTRDFSMPGVSFTGGVGILSRASLPRPR